jgi:exonuclease III
MYLCPAGRTIKTDHGAFVLFNVYFPNAGSTRERLEYKLQFYSAFQVNKREQRRQESESHASHYLPSFSFLENL